MADCCSRFLIGLAYMSLIIGIAKDAIAADVYCTERSADRIDCSTQLLDPSYKLVARGDAPAAAVTRSTPARVQKKPSRSLASQIDLIEHYARQHAVDAALVIALVDVESGFQSNALSPKGAYGPMQLMPSTARRYHVTDRTDLAQNIEAGVHYLKDLLSLHKGNEALALASYNAGEGAVKRHGQRIPPYRETMLYVAAVLARAQAARETIGTSAHSVTIAPLGNDFYAASF